MFSEVHLTIPDVNKSFKSGSLDYSGSAKKANVATLKSIMSSYGKYIQQWGEALQIPDGVIAGFIATESGGKMVPANAYGATGLMQVTPTTVYETITGWSKSVKTPMPAEVVAEIKKKIPVLLQSPAPSFASVKGTIASLIAKDASFNILAGCIALRWLSERFSRNGNAQFNKVMIAYNAGAYTSSLVVAGTKTQANTVPTDTTTLVNNSAVPAESRAYLIKMLGKDGFLDLFYKQKLV